MILLFSHVSMNHSNQSSARLEMDSGKESETTHSPSSSHLQMLELSHQLESEFVLYGIGDFPFQYDNAQSVVRFSREQPKQLSYQKISPER